jgi:hypothetical protein
MPRREDVALGEEKWRNDGTTAMSFIILLRPSICDVVPCIAYLAPG